MTSTTSDSMRESTRDDRTARTLGTLLSADGVALALTHFANSRVEVVAPARLLDARNGRTTLLLALNMLSRFVGVTSLRLVGPLDDAGTAFTTQTLHDLSEIDTRPGREVRLVSAVEQSAPAAVLVIGRSADIAEIRSYTDVIAIGFDGWRSQLRRGDASLCIEAIPSPICFGGMAAACFGVAEVFKTLIATSVAAVDIPTWVRRFTRVFDFDVWKMERSDTDNPTSMGMVDEPVDIPVLDVSDVLQVGAGAVGNASAFALAVLPETQGSLAVADMKHVDIKNLNRCLLFREHHVNDPKVLVLAQELARYGFTIEQVYGPFTADMIRHRSVLVSTVDNNDVRHQMQESLPAFLVQGSTGNTTVCVSVHTSVDGRSCLVCRHPDPSTGVSRRRPLTVAEAAMATGLDESVIASGRFDGSMEITDALISSVAAHDPRMGRSLRQAREEGRDLCGALGDMRATFGIQEGPNEASVPFVSVLAGILATAEVVKIQLRRKGISAPVLDNVLQMDLARDYSRVSPLAFREPQRDDCALCRDRRDDVAQAYISRNGALPSR